MSEEREIINQQDEECKGDAETGFDAGTSITFFLSVK
jgi:hypothetical protein